jgi:hypothetical protein
MLASVELKKREIRDDLDFLQMNGYVMQQTHNLKLTTITFVEPTETNMAAD